MQLKPYRYIQKFIDAITVIVIDKNIATDTIKTIAAAIDTFRATPTDRDTYIYKVRYTATATDRVTFTATSAARVAYEVTDTKILCTASYAITVIA